MINKTTRYSLEIRERAVRMVLEHQAEYDSQWAAMGSIVAKIGCTAETLRKWVRRAERDQGLREELASTDRERLPPRARRDMALKPETRRVWDENFQVYGAKKVWRQLNREQIPEARCTVERLMGVPGLQGAVRGKAYKTTVPDDATERPADLMQRQFQADRPNQLWEADFT